MNAQLQTQGPPDVLDRAQEIYNRLIKPTLEAGNVGRLVAIDVDSEDFEIGDEVLPLSFRLQGRRPNAQIGTLKIGGGAVRRIGFVPQRSQP